jgi:lipopolysaccharide biosynthesis regulator YciM
MAQECAICLFPPNNPEELPCGHTFCSNCIEELRKRAYQGQGSDACPLCRRPLDGTAENFFMEAVFILMREDPLQNIESPMARRCLEHALALDENHYGALITFGEMISDEDPARAVDFIQRALVANDRDPAAILALGTALQKQGKLAESKTAYERAVKNATGNSHKGTLCHAHMKLAMLHEEMGRMDLSILAYGDARQADLANFLVPFNMGVALEEVDNERAISAYKEAIAMKQDFYPAIRALAKAYRQRIILGANDNSSDAGVRRGHDAQLWLAELLKARLNSPSAEETRDCDDELRSIQQHFPNVWMHMIGSREVVFPSGDGV